MLLIEQNKQIVISADKSPSDLDGVQDRLKSRLRLWISSRYPSNNL